MTNSRCDVLYWSNEQKRPMRYSVEIVLRERDYAVTEEVHHHGNPPADWTEIDVEGVLTSMLAAIDRAKNPGEERGARPAARLQLDRRADRRRRGDRDGDSERRRGGGPVRHPPAPARRPDHARARRGSRDQARRPLILSRGASPLGAPLHALRAPTKRRKSRYEIARRVRPGLGVFTERFDPLSWPAPPLPVDSIQSKCMCRRDHEVTVPRPGARRR